MNVDIIELAKQCPDAIISVKASDLIAANQHLLAAMGGRAEQAADDSTFLSVVEVAKILKVSKPTLWRWNDTGYLRANKVGRRVLYRMADIREFMNNKK